MVLTALCLWTAMATAQSGLSPKDDLWSLEFVGNRGLLVSTYPTPDVYLSDYYYTALPTQKYRKIGRFREHLLSESGKYLATLANDELRVYRTNGFLRVCKGPADSLGSFSPDERHFSWMTYAWRRVSVGDLRDGKIKTCVKFREDFDRYAPSRDAKFDSFYITGWVSAGVELSLTYKKSPTSHYVTALLDPWKDRLVKKVSTNNSNSHAKLPDGSVVYDEFEDKDESMGGRTRIIRVHKKKRTVLFDRTEISAGHEMSAGYSVARRVGKVIVYGVDRGSQTARIWLIDAKSGKQRIVAKGKYKMPKWADGSSMLVSISDDGKWLAYDDFLTHRKVHLKKLR